jgi:hypothetical protein
MHLWAMNFFCAFIPEESILHTFDTRHPKRIMVQSQSTPPQNRGLARVMTNGEMVFQDNYEPNSILLTGGCGFIGSHVAILLTTKYPDYKVRNLHAARVQML